MEGEPQQVRAVRVDVLHPVDDEQDGAPAGQGAQDLGDAEPQRDGVPAARVDRRLAAEHGDGGALGSRQLAEDPGRLGRGGAESGPGHGRRHRRHQRGGRGPGYLAVGRQGRQPQHGLAARFGTGGLGEGELGLAHTGGSGEQGATPGVEGAFESGEEFLAAHRRRGTAHSRRAQGEVRSCRHCPPPPPLGPPAQEPRGQRIRSPPEESRPLVRHTDSTPRRDGGSKRQNAPVV